MLSRAERELVQVLGRLPALSGCQGDDLTALVRRGRVTSLPARWVFVHEGTPGDACYVLLEGQAQVRIEGADRAVLGPGAVVGEMALLNRSLRAATVLATTAIQALRLEYADLAVLLDTRPRLRAAFTAVLDAHRMADADASAGPPDEA